MDKCSVETKKIMRCFRTHFLFYFIKSYCLVMPKEVTGPLFTLLSTIRAGYVGNFREVRPKSLFPIQSSLAAFIFPSLAVPVSTTEQRSFCYKY